MDLVVVADPLFDADNDGSQFPEKKANDKRDKHVPKFSDFAPGIVGTLHQVRMSQFVSCLLRLILYAFLGCDSPIRSRLEASQPAP